MPQPCLAVLLLIPCTTKTPDTGNTEHGQKLFYMKQPDALGNACGTIALFHAFANHMAELGPFLSFTPPSAPRAHICSYASSRLAICEDVPVHRVCFC